MRESRGGTGWVRWCLGESAGGGSCGEAVRICVGPRHCPRSSSSPGARRTRRRRRWFPGALLGPLVVTVTASFSSSNRPTHWPTHCGHSHNHIRKLLIVTAQAVLHYYYDQPAVTPPAISRTVRCRRCCPPLYHHLAPSLHNRERARVVVAAAAAAFLHIHPTLQHYSLYILSLSDTETMAQSLQHL